MAAKRSVVLATLFAVRLTLPCLSHTIRNGTKRSLLLVILHKPDKRQCFVNTNPLRIFIFILFTIISFPLYKLSKISVQYPGRCCNWRKQTDTLPFVRRRTRVKWKHSVYTGVTHKKWKLIMKTYIFRRVPARHRGSRYEHPARFTQLKVIYVPPTPCSTTSQP